MASARTQISYLSPSLAPSQQQPRNKLQRHRPEGNVLPARSLPTPSTSTGYQRDTSYVTGYSAYAQAGYGNGLTGAGGGGSEAGSSTGRGTGYGRLQGALQQAKESRKAKRGERVRRGEVGLSGQVVDEDGVAHDSENVRFRTATPVHLQQPRDNGNAVPNDDDSASSSSESSHGESEASAFPSSPYTYQSTHRTSASTHHYPSKLTGTGCAIPSYLSSTPHRTSVDYAGAGGGALAVPRAPSPRRISAEYADKPTSLKSTSKSKRTAHQPQHQFTTSSYQPPAPAFSTFGAQAPTLRLPPKPPSSDSNSLHGSLGKLSLGSTAGTENGASGYNKLGSSRPQRTEGTALDAGVHGMKRSWDGFKLDMRFGTHKATSKVSRKINSTLGI